MNKIDPKRAAVFVAVFGFLAILLNTLVPHVEDSQQKERYTRPVSRPEVQPIPATRPFEPGNYSEANNYEAQQALERARRAKEEAAAAHAKYLARYLNTKLDRKPGIKTVALVIVSENGKPNRAVSQAVVDMLESDTVQVLPSFFKPEFVTDGLFNGAFNEPNEIFKKLELAKSLDVVLLARQKAQYSTQPTLENVITANMELEMTAFPTGASSHSQTWTFRAPGPGFKKEDARAMAEERIIKQISRDTNISLNTIFQNN